MRALRILIIKSIVRIKWIENTLIEFYKLIAKLVIAFVQWRFPTSQVWVRNSLALGDLVPGLSDIDFTIFNTATAKDLDHRILRDFLEWIRYFIPVIGEFNYYTSETLSLAHDLANPHELDRDIILKTKIQTVEKAKTKSDDLVYLLRLYHSDIKNLRLNPELRIKKWNRVFLKVDATIGYNGLASVESVIRTYISSSELEMTPLVYPHLWLEHNWQRLDRGLGPIDEFKNGRDFLKQVTLGQVRWEIFGILGQLPFLKNANDMQYHFSHLARIVESIDSSESRHLRKSIDQAILQTRQY